MFRFLFIILAIWGAILIGRHLYRVGRSHGEALSRSERTPTDTARCAHCGLHVPKGEALYEDGHCYCSAAHREAGPG
ncbi:PP0621 family protein [Endothiovibrio diazotrophicus]